MITTTVYKWKYTGVKESWGQGWYDTNATGVVPLKDPYFYLGWFHSRWYYNQQFNNFNINCHRYRREGMA